MVVLNKEENVILYLIYSNYKWEGIIFLVGILIYLWNNRVFNLFGDSNYKVIFIIEIFRSDIDKWSYLL